MVRDIKMVSVVDNETDPSGTVNIEVQLSWFITAPNRNIQDGASIRKNSQLDIAVPTHSSIDSGDSLQASEIGSQLVFDFRSTL